MAKIIYEEGTWTLAAATTPDAYIPESAFIGAQSVIKQNGEVHRPVTWVVRTLQLVWTNVGSTVVDKVMNGTDSMAQSGKEIYLVDFGSYSGTYFAVPNSASAEYGGWNLCNVSIALESKVITNTWSPI